MNEIPNGEATPGGPTIKLDDLAFKQLDTLDMETLVNSTQAESTTVLPAKMDAVNAAQNFEPEQALLIVCLDEAGRVSGVVSTEHVREHMANIQNRSVASFARTLTLMLDDPAERARGFRHEGHETRINMYECSVIPHYVAGSPCPDHNVPTTKRKFGDWS